MKVYQKQEDKYDPKSSESDIVDNSEYIPNKSKYISDSEDFAREIYINSQVSIFYDREFVERVEIV